LTVALEEVDEAEDDVRFRLDFFLEVDICYKFGRRAVRFVQVPKTTNFQEANFFGILKLDHFIRDNGAMCNGILTLKKRYSIVSLFNLQLLSIA
jgi:hypothetical protein